jgi:hypothetical protein
MLKINDVHILPRFMSWQVLQEYNLLTRTIAWVAVCTSHHYLATGFTNKSNLIGPFKTHWTNTIGVNRQTKNWVHVRQPQAEAQDKGSASPVKGGKLRYKAKICLIREICSKLPAVAAEYAEPAEITAVDGRILPRVKTSTRRGIHSSFCSLCPSLQPE